MRHFMWYENNCKNEYFYPTQLAGLLRKIAVKYYMVAPTVLLNFPKLVAIWLAKLVPRAKDKYLELEKKVEFYESILNNLPNDLVVFDCNHKYLFLNSMAIRDENIRKFVLHKTDFDYCKFKGISEEFAQKRDDKFKTVLQSKQPYTFEEMKQNNGSIEAVRRTFQPVLDNCGEVKYMLGYGMDITSLRNSESQLQEKVKELNNILDHSFTAVAKLDSNGRILDWNNTAEQITGFSKKEMFSVNFTDRLMPRLRPSNALKIISGIEEFVQNELIGKKIDVRLCAKDGKLFQAQLLIQAYKVGKKTFYAAFFIDTTQQKEQEREVKKIASLPEESPNPILRLDYRNNSVTYFNNAYSAITKGGNDMNDSILQQIKDVIDVAVKYERPEQSEFAFKNRCYSVNVSPNIALGYVNIYCTDITDRKNNEQTIKDINENLSKQVESRTSELKDSNMNLENFAYSVSHDLRAPLRHVSAYSSLLKKAIDENHNEEAQVFFQNITSATQKMDKQIEGLLQFSRFGTSSIKLSTISIKERFEKAFSMYISLHQPITFKFTNNTSAIVKADPALLDTVLENILSNAIKYSVPTRNVEIEIEEKYLEHEYLFVVKDKGIGFDMKYYDKIFGLFQRLHSENTVEGLGIGLSHVKRIIDRHGGRIWAESVPNGGTNFFFTIPK